MVSSTAITTRTLKIFIAMKQRLLCRILFGVLIATSLALTSCKAWRTVTTTSTYTQAQDSTKVTTTITTKTSEEYTGVRKR